MIIRAGGCRTRIDWYDRDRCLVQSQIVDPFAMVAADAAPSSAMYVQVTQLTAEPAEGEQVLP